MNVLQPVLAAIEDGTFKQTERNKILDLIKDAFTQVSPGKGKYEFRKFKNGVMVAKNLDNDDLKLSSYDPNLKLDPVTLKYNPTYNRYKHPIDKTEIYNSLNQIVKDYAVGKYQK